MKGLTNRLILLGLLVVQTALADVRLPKVFGSHMVLQRRKPIPVWGWADAGERVTVVLRGAGSTGQTKTVKTGKDGRWRVNLDPLEASGPFELGVNGRKNSVAFDDVLVGEVWVCSGQSNMEWPLRAAANAKKEIGAATYPQIRQLAVKKAISLAPKDDIDGEWTVCSPQTAPDYTAVGYFFARQLLQELNVPIGLINTSWGGTHSETWTSRDALARDPELGRSVADLPVDFAEINRKAQERTEKLIQEKQGQLPTPAEERTWSGFELNDSRWLSMGLPQHWEFKAGLPGFDGVVWFRKEITIPAGADLTRAQLTFGPIDDADSTYVNGQLVGFTNVYSLPRSYTLPANLLKPGRNLIAVRVNDTGGGGGIGGQPDDMVLTAGSTGIPLAGEWRYRAARIHPASVGASPNDYGTLLFNAMINPLIPYGIQGAIWYQGESNAGRAYQYRRAFPLMIQDWRQRWGADFPFLFVQLASFNSANGDSHRGSAWAELREAQTMTLQLPNTGMAVTSDIGERDDIHPKNKHDVGKRLAAEAMRVVYTPAEGTADVSRGPMFEKMAVDGNRAVLTFQHTGSGLMSKDKYGYVRGFELAGADHRFYYAKAEIKGNTVVVSSDSVAAPVAVRYGWADDNGDVNLYNREGFPAVPFRSDSWKGITEGVKFGD